MAYVTVTTEGGRPAAALAKLLEQRSKWLNETAEQACAATMIDILVSLRALTVIAKPNKREVRIDATSLNLSFVSHGKSKPRPCLRLGKTRYTLKSNERMGYATGDWKSCKVWKWNDESRGRIWYIIAHSSNEARDWAFARVKKRAQNFKGLARIALSKLMMMSGSKTSQQMDNAKAASKAQSMTRVVKQGNGRSYSLEADDLLQYAKLALKGGDAAINTAMMKAANKITSVINQKSKNLLMFTPLETPFPEVKSRK